MKPNLGFIRKLRAFWERFLLVAPLVETQGKRVSFILCHCCTCMSDLERGSHLMSMKTPIEGKGASLRWQKIDGKG